MGRFRPVEWVTPSTVEEATRILKEKRARPISGGTGLYELAKRGMLPDTDALVDLESLALEFVKVENGTLRIGAGSRFSWLLNQEVIQRQDLVGFKEGISSVKPIQVRNAATVGGAVSISIPFLDFPPAALGFDASVVLAGPEGKERVVPIRNFWLDYLLPDIRKGELVTELRVPLSNQNTGSAFVKLGRAAGDFALVNVCTRLVVDKDKCKEAIIALGGVANTPVRQERTENVLRGQKITKDVILKAAETLNELNPVPSIHGSSWYKREIAKIMVRDALTKSAERAGVSIS